MDEHGGISASSESCSCAERLVVVLTLSEPVCLSEALIYSVYTYIYTHILAMCTHIHTPCTQTQHSLDFCFLLFAVHKVSRWKGESFPPVQKPLVRMEVIYGLSPCRI